MNLLWQVMRRTVTWGGLYKNCKQGISRGCPLSPLLGAFFLHDLDSAMETSGLFYVRFMDDILVLALTRHKLRTGVRTVNQHFERLGLRQHPDKTFIGRIERGFDFLGYHFSRAGLRIASATWDRFIEKATRLYEQERVGQTDALGCYVRRWMGWATDGLEGDHKPRRMAGLMLRQTVVTVLSTFPTGPTHTGYA
ncbi:MAG: RNA-directed DNA polymerase [Gammaproteobacteria bacterium]